MSIIKTLGGDRLGSGKKMKVELHGYERSNHDLSYIFRSSISAGTLVPFMKKIALPGDTFDIDLQCDVKTHPTVGPLFGSFKAQLDIFQAPIRLYNSLLHNNMLGIGLDINQVKFPVIELNSQILPDPTEADVNTSQVNPSSILAYLGIRGIGQLPTGVPGPLPTRKFNAIPLLAYWEIYKQYYANKQETIGAVIHTETTSIITITQVQAYNNSTDPDVVLAQVPASPVPFVYNNAGQYMDITYPTTPADPSQILFNTLEHGQVSAQQLFLTWTDYGGFIEAFYNVGKWGTTTIITWDYINVNTPTNGKPQVVTFPLANIDEMRKQLLADSSTTTPFNINTPAVTPYTYLTNYSVRPNYLNTQEGLALKTYQSDLFNNWILTDWIDGTDGITNRTAVAIVGGQFTIDQLQLSKKVYDYLNRIAVSGGTYDDWLDVTYAHDRFTRAEMPMYMGGLSKELVFQEVVSNAGSGDQPLGTLGGRGTMSAKHKGGKVVIKVDEPSYIIGIVSLTPRIDYSQGNEWDVHLQTLDDLHKPALDEIGFQELITEQMAWWDTKWDSINSKWIQNSAGKQPAWINYMTSVNQTYGNFAYPKNEMFMTLNRRYEYTDTLPYSNILDLTTYIDPSKYNFIFAETALDAQNFWCQIAVNIQARRKMSAKVMPNL